MKKKISIIIAVIVIIALIAALPFSTYLSNRTHFNEGYVNWQHRWQPLQRRSLLRVRRHGIFFQPVRRREAVFDVSGRKQSGQAL